MNTEEKAIDLLHVFGEKLAIKCVDEMIELCSYILQELAVREARTCDITRTYLDELIELKKSLEASEM